MPMSPMGNPAFGHAPMGFMGGGAPATGKAGGMGAGVPGFLHQLGAMGAMRGSAFPAMFGGAEASARGTGMNGAAARSMPGFGMSSTPMASLNMGLVWSCAPKSHLCPYVAQDLTPSSLDGPAFDVVFPLRTALTPCLSPLRTSTPTATWCTRNMVGTCRGWACSKGCGQAGWRPPKRPSPRQLRLLLPVARRPSCTTRASPSQAGWATTATSKAEVRCL